ncbi:MAG: hypothetical protein Q8M07_00715, partial [Prosthecobacter sp.]|nr:hypothetical protein [Prosthecobacter sp.]
VKFIVASAALSGVLLGSCQTSMTLEQAQARCAEKGGLLTIIYTQSITASGIGEQIPTPGDCISPSRFETTAPKPSGAPPPAL